MFFVSSLVVRISGMKLHKELIIGKDDSGRYQVWVDCYIGQCVIADCIDSIESAIDIALPIAIEKYNGHYRILP